MSAPTLKEIEDYAAKDPQDFDLIDYGEAHNYESTCEELMRVASSQGAHYTLKTFLKYLNYPKVLKLSHIKIYFDYLIAKGMSRNTVRIFREDVISYLRKTIAEITPEVWHAAHEQIKKYRYGEGVIPPPAGRNVTPAEVNQVVSSYLSKNNMVGLRDAAFIAVLAGTGMRIGDCNILQMDNVTKVAGGELRYVLSFVQSKSKKSGLVHKVDITGGWAEIFSSWLAARKKYLEVEAPELIDGGPVWILSFRRKGAITGMTQARGFRVLYDGCMNAGIMPFTAHDLRRTKITRLLERNIDPVLVSKIIGHRRIETTVSYDRRGDGDKLAAVLGDELDAPIRGRSIQQIAKDKTALSVQSAQQGLSEYLEKIQRKEMDRQKNEETKLGVVADEESEEMIRNWFE